MGRLLVATPQTDDPNFARSVVLVLHHDGDGAQGVVLNQPIPTGIDDVLPGWEEHASAPATLFKGGPVSLDSALGLVAVPGVGPGPAGVRRLFGGVALLDLDAEPDLVGTEVAGLRIFAGYAGWSAGQLDGEIRRGGWYVLDAEAADTFTEEPEHLWQRVLRRQGGSLAWVASFPADPTQN